MRVIVNIPSGVAAKAVGWRARAVEVSKESEVGIEEVLRAIPLVDTGSLYDLLVEEDRLKDDWMLYVNGTRIPGNSRLDVSLRDNVQVHIMDNPHPGIPRK